MNLSKLVGCCEGSAQSEIYSTEYLRQKRRKILKAIIDLLLMILNKEEQCNLIARRRKEAIKNWGGNQ